MMKEKKKRKENQGEKERERKKQKERTEVGVGEILALKNALNALPLDRLKRRLQTWKPSRRI